MFRRPSGSRRSKTTLRFPRLSCTKAGLGTSDPMPSEPNVLRIGSPVGGSTLTTSAPQSAQRRGGRSGHPDTELHHA